MKKKHKESFKGTEYKISGIVDIDKILILYAIILTFLFIIALGFVIFLEGWSIRYFLILGAFYLCLLVFVDGSILLGVYLLNRKAWLKVDKSGISGRGKLIGKAGFGLTDFSYQWKEIEKIGFDHQSFENQIVIVKDGELHIYSFTYRFVKNSEFISAVRTFGNENLFDQENIETVEDSYSYRSIILRCLGWAILLAIVFAIKIMNS